jgi:hypothetical protein
MTKVATDIKGSFGETICRLHFEAMGYSVDPIGIEHIAPSFCKVSRSSNEHGQYWKKLEYAKFSKVPDFLMSRINASGEKEAVLVEVKYTESFKGDKLLKDLEKDYKSYLKFPILFYVISYKKDPCIFIFYSDSDSEEIFKWRKVDEMTAYPLYTAASNAHMDLKTSYEKIIKPILNSVKLKNVLGEDA